MALKINKFTYDESKYKFFDSDEEFEDFCFAPYAFITFSKDGVPNGTKWDYSPEYKQCIKDDVHFVIRDLNSKVFKRKAATKRLPVIMEGNPGYKETVLAQLPVSNFENYFRFQMREGAEKRYKMEKAIKKIIEGRDEAALLLKKSGLTKSDLKPFVDKGNVDAQLVLLLGLVSPDYEIFVEDFEDEETHKMVPVERHRPLDNAMFDADPEEIESLSSEIIALLPEQSDETVSLWKAILHYGEPVYTAILKELAGRGNKEAIEELEAMNPSYLDNPQDLADDECPDEAVIKISGHPHYLDQIESMVKDLTKAHGMPGNEAGLFVNLMFLFKALNIDWVDNTGILMNITRHNESSLTLELECNPLVDAALVEAFQKACPELDVEVCS